MIYLRLFLTFFQIGLFTIGGGYAMIPLINEKILANGWMTQELFIDFIAISESTPGPFAVNIATFVGAHAAGGGAAAFFGAFCATLGVILPSFIIIYIIASFLSAKFSEKKLVKDVMYGLRPAVVGLIASAFASIFISTVFAASTVFDLSFKNTDFAAIILFVIIFLLSRIKKPKKLHPILLIGISAVLGVITYGLIIPAI